MRDYDFPRFLGSQCACVLLPLQCVYQAVIFVRLSSVCHVAFTKNTVLGMRLQLHQHAC